MLINVSNRDRENHYEEYDELQLRITCIKPCLPQDRICMVTKGKLGTKDQLSCVVAAHSCEGIIGQYL